MKEHCIIFVLKDDEFFLTENINKLLELKEKYDLYFVTRKHNERVNLILNSNQLINIELTYDVDYYEALKSGFEFVQNLKYKSWIEFGELNNVNLDEIDKLNEINKEINYEKNIILASRYIENKKQKRWKFYIFLTTKQKICDPYTKFKIYNQVCFNFIKNDYDYTMYPHYLISFLRSNATFLEVKIKSSNYKKNNRKIILIEKLYLFIYTVFILPYTKRNNKK